MLISHLKSVPLLIIFPLPLKSFYLFFGYAGSLLLHRLFSHCVQWELLSSCGVWAPGHVRSSWTRDQTHVPCIGRRILYHWATKEVPLESLNCPCFCDKKSNSLLLLWIFVIPGPEISGVRKDCVVFTLAPAKKASALPFAESGLQGLAHCLVHFFGCY